MRRVAITGLGVICALGHNRCQVWEALSKGESAILPIQSLNTSELRFKNAAEVRDYDPSAHFEQNQLEMLDRFAQFALIAAREAIQDAGIVFTSELRART